jgi:Protein of unknown function (DUF2934)
MKSKKRVSSESVAMPTRAARDVVPVIQASASAEEIARRAYEIYEEGGRVDGRALDDWLEAERELSRRR